MLMYNNLINPSYTAELLVNLLGFDITQAENCIHIIQATKKPYCVQHCTNRAEVVENCNILMQSGIECEIVG